MPSDSDVTAGTAELAVLRKLQHPAQKKTHNLAEREMEELDSIIDVRAQNSGIPIQILHDMDPDDEGLPFWGRTYRGQSPIIPHSENKESDSVVKYDECHHDVAAIHWDATPSALDRKEGEEAILYLRKVMRKQLEMITNTVEYLEEDHEFELILFSDFDDLEEQILDLSENGILEHPEREMEMVADELGLETAQSKVGEVNLRSLSLLLPDGKLDPPKNGSSCSAYFLNLMKPDSETVDFCDYSSCVFSVSKKHQKLLGNFFNYLQAFLSSSLTYETRSGASEDGIRTSTRTRAISINSSSEYAGRDLVPSAFATHGKGPKGEIAQYDNIYNSQSGSLGETFCKQPDDDDPPELFNWLNQYNLRVFNKKMDPTADPWYEFNFRSLTNEIEKEIIEFCNDLKSQSTTWENHMFNCRDLNFNGTNFVSIMKVNRVFSSLTPASYEDICNELRANRKHLETLQFQFYREIIPNFHVIRETVQKVRHSGEYGRRNKIPMSFLYNRYKIELDIILLLSILKPVKSLCFTITDFNDPNRYAGIHSWRGFDKWRIYRREVPQ